MPSFVKSNPRPVFIICRYSTPLHDAVCCGRQEVVRILLERGANVNEIDYKDMTPLKLAIRSGSVLQRRTFSWPLGHFAFPCLGMDKTRSPRCLVPRAPRRRWTCLWRRPRWWARWTRPGSGGFQGGSRPPDPVISQSSSRWCDVPCVWRMMGECDL